MALRAPLLGTILAAFVLTGCASQSPPAPAAQPVSLRFTVDNGKVTPAPDRREVAKGSQVEIVVESTAPLELHVHGYDLRSDAAPGKPAVVRFVPDRTGTFEVEAHPDTLLVQLVIR